MAHIHSPSQSTLVKRAFNVLITAAVTTGAWLPILNFRQAMAVFDTLPTGAGTTSDCKLQQADDSSGTNPIDVVNAVFVQGTTAIGARVSLMDINLAKLTKPYITLVHTGAGGSAAGLAVGLIEFFEPAEPAVTQDVAAIQFV